VSGDTTWYGGGFERSFQSSILLWTGTDGVNPVASLCGATRNRTVVTHAKVWGDSPSCLEVHANPIQLTNGFESVAIEDVRCWNPYPVKALETAKSPIRK
jgi:hypothetical protein